MHDFLYSFLKYSQCDSFSLLGPIRYFLVQNGVKGNCRDKVYNKNSECRDIGGQDKPSS